MEYKVVAHKVLRWHGEQMVKVELTVEAHHPGYKPATAVILGTCHVPNALVPYHDWESVSGTVILHGSILSELLQHHVDKCMTAEKKERRRQQNPDLLDRNDVMHNRVFGRMEQLAHELAPRTWGQRLKAKFL